MIKFGTIFRFAAPDGWQQFQEDGRYIFRGPNRRELIVSASLIQGILTPADLAAVQEKLFQNAEKSVKSAAAHSALKVMQPFQKRGASCKCGVLELTRTNTRGRRAVLSNGVP